MPRLLAAIVQRFILVLSCGAAIAGQINVTYDSAGNQQPSPSVCSNCFLSFNNLANGLQNYTAAFGSTGVTGTYTNIDIVAADQYGGADSTGKYAAVGGRSDSRAFTLTLNRPVGYFGLWWSATDARNSIQFFLGGVAQATFTPGSLINQVGHCSNPASNPYCGNPNSPYRTQDPAHAFLYLNFYGMNGTKFDKVIFSNDGLASSFESDNHAVLVDAPAPMTGTSFRSLGTPEPPTFLLLLIPALAGWIARRSGRKSPAASEAIPA